MGTLVAFIDDRLASTVTGVNDEGEAMDDDDDDESEESDGDSADEEERKDRRRRRAAKRRRGQKLGIEVSRRPWC